MPPSFVLRHSRRRPRWTDRDRLLVLAWQQYQDSLCGECGQERSRAYHPDMDGWYEVRPITCHACAALDEHRTKHKDAKRAVKEYVLDTRPRRDVLPLWIPDLSPDPEE